MAWRLAGVSWLRGEAVVVVVVVVEIEMVLGQMLLWLLLLLMVLEVVVVASCSRGQGHQRLGQVGGQVKKPLWGLGKGGRQGGRRSSVASYWEGQGGTVGE